MHEIGLYIHVPFCLKKCNYCDFVSYPRTDGEVDTYLTGLRREAGLRSSLNIRPNTVFVGGGTPTCLDNSQIKRVLDYVSTFFPPREGAEYTVEANPGTVTADKLSVLREAGVNRLSIGVQACQQELLARLGRLHTFDQAAGAVKLARRAGFENINLDLIFSIPGQTLEDWLGCLNRVLSLKPEHIATYSLQLEESTPLGRAVATGKLQASDEEGELAMYKGVISLLKEAGYRHYEVSNFALPGRECRHNLLYWHNGQYLGLGPGAHSRLGNLRWCNHPGVAGYAAALSAGQVPEFEREDLSRRVMMAETIIMGLRLRRGLSLAGFEGRFGCRLEAVYAAELSRLKEMGLVEIRNGNLRVTSAGLPLANIVFREFV